jgi:hypothetical protein
MIAKTFEKINNLLKNLDEREPIKKRPQVNGMLSLIFLLPKFFIKKMMCNRNNF